MLRLLIITSVSFIALHHNPAEAQIFGRWKNSSRGAKLQRYESQRPLTTADHRERSSRTSSGLDIRIGVGRFGYGYYPASVQSGTSTHTVLMVSGMTLPLRSF